MKNFNHFCTSLCLKIIMFLNQHFYLIQNIYLYNFIYKYFNEKQFILYFNNYFENKLSFIINNFINIVENINLDDDPEHIQKQLEVIDDKVIDRLSKISTFQLMKCNFETNIFTFLTIVQFNPGEMFIIIFR